MSWYPFGPNCDCSSVPQTLVQCPFPGPGILSNPRAVAAFDYRNQPGQVPSPNVASFLVAYLDGNGNPVVQWSNSPSVLPTSYPLALNQKFTGLLDAMGSSGGMRILTPTGLSAIAYLTANPDGTWNLSPAPSSTIPDPLTIGTINANALNSVTLNIAGLSTFTGLSAGTVTQNIGLNASNQLVTGNTSVSAVAQYYENTSLVSVATPNSTVSIGTGVVIGNEIFDPNGLAHVQDAQTIVVDVKGTYLVRWGGTWGPVGAGASPRRPALSLAYNSTGNIVSNGYCIGGAQNTNSATVVFGEWPQALNAGDKLFIMPTGNPNTTTGNSGLTNVGMILQRVQ